MPFVSIEWSPRSLEMRREVAKAITEIICEVAGVQPDTVRIAFHDIERDHLAMAGKLLSEGKSEKK